MVINFNNYIDKECPYCGKVTHTTSAYTLHTKQCHYNKESNWYKQNHIEKICPKCGVTFISATKEQVFCCRKCANSHSHTENSKTKISNGVKEHLISIGFKSNKIYCYKCGKQIRKNLSGLCNSCYLKSDYRKELDKRHSEIMKGKPRWNIHRNQTSYAEDFFINVLDNNGIKYEREKSIKKLDNIHCYFLDFYIEVNNIKIDLEIDGSQHKEREESDKNRDSYLESLGIKVYRIPWNNINSEKGKKIMKDKISNFLNFLNEIKEFQI